MKAQESSYDAMLRRELGELVDAVDLPELSKRYLRARWLDQMLWAEARAKSARDRHYVLRIVSIVGGVVVPALVGVNVQGELQALVGWTTFAVSLLVAICLALENFFRWGERWTHYRRLAELLKSEGWLFLELGGSYQELGGHAKAYPEFVKRIEALLGSDVDVFIAQVARDKTKPDESTTSGDKK